VHPLMMGLEEHLLAMFCDDSEFHDAPSHLGAKTIHGATTMEERQPAPSVAAPPAPGAPIEILWADEAQKELKKIPFFVRGKARNNTEKYARERGLTNITLETLYDAKAHYAR
jgi:light-independent protochlorophyllide reductase subunit B